jgi:hypothetical protein
MRRRVLSLFAAEFLREFAMALFMVVKLAGSFHYVECHIL